MTRAMTPRRLCGVIAFSIIFEVSGVIAEEPTFDQQYSFVDQKRIAEIIAKNYGPPSFDEDGNFDVSPPGMKDLESITDDPGIIIVDFTYLGLDDSTSLVRYFDSRNEISLRLDCGLPDLGGVVPVNLSTIGMLGRSP
jgi:hypothetical protein